AAEVGHWTGRCNHVRELIGDPLDQLTMPRLVASPLPGGALPVVHEPKEPARGSHGGDLTAGGCSTSSRGDAPSVPRCRSGARRRCAPNTAPTTTRAAPAR